MPAPKLSNRDALGALTKAGYDNDVDFKRTIISNTRYMGRSVQKLKYYIPRETWTKVTGKRFNIPFRKGMRVNLTKDKAFNKSGRNRFYYRGASFTHYGFGSGKKYASRGDSLRFYGTSERVVKVGKTFIINPIAAQIKVNQFKAKKFRWSSRPHVPSSYRESLVPTHFYQKVILSTNGIMAPKKLMTGVISDIFVYVHKYWNFKRESRYLILFENGSSAMLRRSDIQKCKVSDFDSKDNAYQCDKIDGCKQHRGCTHEQVHRKNNECDIACPDNSDAHCRACFDFKKLHELVYSDGAFQEDGNK